MALEVFDFPYHLFETVNPESGFRGQFGNSYIFTAAPSAPDQRVFKLSFPAMKWFVDADGVVDATQNPQYNMKALIDFYHLHRLHESFQYNHPVYGTLVVKFNKPLVEPKGEIGENGVVRNVEIELIEIP